MSYVNLTPCERKTLIEGILQSDVKYLEKLIERRYKLVLELPLELSFDEDMIELE